jgi:hypothetical protein
MQSPATQQGESPVPKRLSFFGFLMVWFDGLRIYRQRLDLLRLFR